MAATKKIVEKLKDIESDIKAGNEGLAQRLQSEAVEAILGGLASEAWKKYMCNLASNPVQLQRLIGNDVNFMQEEQNPYGRETLAYIVGNSTCGVSTDTGTSRNIKAAQLSDLDRDLDDTVRPMEDCPAAG